MDTRDYYTYGDFLAEMGDKAPTVHEVEDKRSPRDRAQPAPQPKPQRPRKRWRKGVALTCLMVMLLSFALLCADFLLPRGVAEYLVSAFSPEASAVYAVAGGSYDSLAEARTASDGARSRGGAGFILFDGKYHVLLSAYATREEAEKVSQKNGYTMLPILTDGMTAGDLPIVYRQKAKALEGYHVDVYAKLYDLSDQLAQGGTTVRYCRQRITAVREGLQSLADPFLEAAADATDAPTANYRSALLATLAALENLQNARDDSLFLADLRWTYIMVLRVNSVAA